MGRALNTGPEGMMGPHGFEKHSIVVAKLTNTVSSDHMRTPGLEFGQFEGKASWP